MKERKAGRQKKYTYIYSQSAYISPNFFLSFFYFLSFFLCRSLLFAHYLFIYQSVHIVLFSIYFTNTSFFLSFFFFLSVFLSFSPFFPFFIYLSIYLVNIYIFCLLHIWFHWCLGFGECGVPLYCHCSQVHSDPEW